MPRKPTGNPRGRPAKTPYFGGDPLPFLTPAQRRTVEIEARAGRADIRLGIQRWVRPYPRAPLAVVPHYRLSPAGVVARQAGVTKRAVNAWRHQFAYRAAIIAAIKRDPENEGHYLRPDSAAGPCARRDCRLTHYPGRDCDLRTCPRRQVLPKLVRTRCD